MPTESTYPPVDIPPIDIWGLIFESKDREFPDDKGASILYIRDEFNFHANYSFKSSTWTPKLVAHTPTPR